MKHAGSAALDQLGPLLQALRARAGLTEKKRGVFYRGSRAFIHFHEDPRGTFADVRAESGEFERIQAEGPVGLAAVLARVDAALSAGARRSKSSI